jgi:hypothetical protein
VHRTSHAVSIRNTFILLGALFALSGCLVSEEADPPEDQDDDSSGEILKNHELSGSVGDGPVVTASVLISTTGGDSLGTAESDATANFNVVVKTMASHYPLQLNASGGTDLVTMAAPDFTFKSAVLNPSGNSVANLNPFTTVAVELATDLTGGRNEDNIVTALDVVAEQLGGGLAAFPETAAMTAAIDGSNVAEMVRASESLGEVVRRTRDALRAVGRNVSGNGIVEAIASDLTDRVLDGRGGPRADARTAAIANLLRSQIMLETMPNRLQVQGSDATERMETAIAQVFSGTPSPALDELAVTAGMLETARIGLLAGTAFQTSAELDQLLLALDELQPGMTPAQASSVLSAGTGTVIDGIVLAAASATATELELINGVVRTGTLPGADNQAPEIAGQPGTSVAVGSTYEFVPTASDADGDELTFSIAGQPSWTDFDTATGTLAGTPAEGDVGSSSGIVVSVSDGEDSASLPAFTLTVRAPDTNAPPEIGGTPPAAVAVGSSYDFTPSASDADVDALTFSITGQPSWTSFDEATGRLQGTPASADVGAHGDIVITVSDGQANASLVPFTITVDAPPAGNSAPQISGTPPPSVLANSSYEFVPQASDADGDTLTFSVTALPSWASFDTATGRLSGTPGDGAVGVYDGIRIDVSDGEDSASLGPFQVTVDAIALGSATLSWTPPTENTDGSSLTDLAGFRIYWGTAPGNYTESVTINNPGLTSYVIEDLSPGSYEFVSTALNSAGVESNYSNPATKTIP